MSAPPLGGDRTGAGQGGNGLGRGAPGGEIPKGIATAIAEISERATLLVREEIELAKAEVTAKATKLVRGAVIGVAAGIFMVTALFFFLIGCAWLLYYYLPGNAFTYFWGFFAMAAILLILGLIAGLIAARAVKRGTPPMPEMAIEEARLIRDTVSASMPETPSTAAQAPGTASGPGAATVAGAPAPGPSPAPYGAAAPHATGLSAAGSPRAAGSPPANEPPRANEPPSATEPPLAGAEKEGDA